MDFFEELTDATVTEREGLYAVPQIADALNGSISLPMYVDFLTQAYHHVKHTVPLLTLARQSLKSRQADFRAAFDEYIEEEAGHDRWILSDIKNCGADADKVRNGSPHHATEVMVAYAYDFVSRLNPLGMFGMVFVLEGTSVALATKGAMAVLHSLKLPAECFNYLISHGSLDQGHMENFRRLMGEVRSPEDQAAIVHVAKAMFVLYANVFRSIPRTEGLKDAR